MLKRLFGAGLAALAGVAFAAGASAQTLDKIMSRGVLVVGTKADYKPFGFRDPSGAIVGFEPDIGKEVADKLGVKLELEPVVSSNRMQFLQQGKIDLMIATMNDKPRPRRRSCRATASPGSTTTPPSPSASPTPSGRTTRCRSRRSSRSPGASP